MLALGDGDSRTVETSAEGSSQEVSRASDSSSVTSESQSQSRSSYIGDLVPARRPGLSQRKRRSVPTLQIPAGDPFILLPPQGDVVGTEAATFKNHDPEDNGNKQSPTQEAKIENFQQFLSNQGFQVGTMYLLELLFFNNSSITSILLFQCSVFFLLLLQ